MVGILFGSSRMAFTFDTAFAYLTYIIKNRQPGVVDHDTFLVKE
jgi:hypothetical protein